MAGQMGRTKWRVETNEWSKIPKRKGGPIVRKERRSNGRVKGVGLMARWVEMAGSGGDSKAT